MSELDTSSASETTDTPDDSDDDTGYDWEPADNIHRSTDQQRIPTDHADPGGDGSPPDNAPDLAAEYDDDSDRAAGYDGDLDALTAEDDQLPIRQSHAATGGDSPEYDDVTDRGAEYDGDLDALTAEDDQLPIRQSHAATGGDSPEYDDVTDRAAEYDGDVDAVATEDHSSEGDKRGPDQSVANDAAAASEQLDDPAVDPSGSRTGTNAEQADHIPADASKQVAALKAENDQLSQDVAKLRGQNDQLSQDMTELRGQNDQLSQDMTELRGQNDQLSQDMTELEGTNADVLARLGRLEDRVQTEPSNDLKDAESDGAHRGADKLDAQQKRRWYRPTAEGLGVASQAATGSAAAVAEKLAPGPVSETALVAAGLGFLAAGVIWVRSKKETRHARRTKD